MKRVETWRWWLPPKPWQGPRAKPYLSAYRMDREAAEKLGALRPEPGSREVVDVAETPEEEAELRRQRDTSAVQVKR